MYFDPFQCYDVVNCKQCNYNVLIENTCYIHVLLVIRSVADVLRAQSRFVKFVGGGG